MANWIGVKLREHKMAPYHLAAKMGILLEIVHAWKDGKARPSSIQIRDLVVILGKHHHI